MIKKDKRKTGIDGEKTAAKYLKKNKYKILDCNYRSRFGEIDIIAKKDDFIVFVEVKARNNNSLGEPREAVTYSKQSKIIKTAEFYILDKKIDLQPRFDVIEVFTDTDTVNHIENAF